MGAFEGICWVLTLVATVLAGFTLFEAFFGAAGAPQQAAGAAMAAALVVVPYVFTRGVQALSSVGRARTRD